MKVQDKIIFTIIFIVAAILLHWIKRINNRLVVNRLKKQSPSLLKNLSWFISDHEKTIISWPITLGVIIFLLLMWTNQIILSLHE